MNLKDKFSNQPDKPIDPDSGDSYLSAHGSVDLFDTSGNVRNICFVQAEGRATFLNYAYLVSAEFSPSDSAVTLEFTTHIVIMKGSNLSPLFDNLKDHRLKTVSVSDKRYSQIKDRSGSIVTEIIIIKFDK